MALRDLMALKESPGAIAQEVAKRLANLAVLEEDEDLDRWASTLAGTLRGVAMGHPERLTAACQGLGITPEDWAADNASAIGPFARALLTATPAVVATVANKHLKAAVPTQETRDEVRRLLVPIWVDLTAAGCAAAALRQPAAERRVFLNTATQDVAAEYVDRAVYCAEGIVPIRSTGVFGEDADGLFEELEELVIEACPPIQGDPSSAGFKAWLSAYPYRRPVLFIHASLSPPQLKDLLDRLTDRFPGLTLFVHGGDNERSASEAAALGVTVIEPPLNAARESEANLYRGELKLFVGA